MSKQGNRGSFSLDKEWLWMLLLILWVLLMIGHSLTPAELSSKESGWVMEMVLKGLHMIGCDGQWLTGHIVRKSAHFLEYCVFGLLLIQNFHCIWKRSDWNIGRAHRGRMEQIIPVAFAVLAVPFCDETVQLFTPGRAGMLVDVWLDISGAVSGILLREAAAVLVHRLAGRRRFRPRRRKWK